MNAKNYLLWISLFVIALVAGLGATQAQTADERFTEVCCPNKSRN